MGPVSYQLLRHKKHLVVAAGLCIVLFLILDHQDIVVMYEQQTPPPPLQFYDNGPDLCIVVRTYKGHGRGIYSLENLLETLEAEVIANKKTAKILLVNTDPTPFFGLQRIISKSRRPEWCEIVELPPEMEKMPWNHSISGYDKTDFAIRLCPKHSRWLMVTNGDNWYLPGWVREMTSDQRADLVGVHFYSRHNSIHTAANVEGWPNDESCGDEHLQSCMENRLRLGTSDLGSVLFKYNKFVAENRLFTSCPSNTMQDGCMIQTLLESNWRTRVIPKCLFSHSPNPWASCIGANVSNIRSNEFFSSWDF